LSQLDLNIFKFDFDVHNGAFYGTANPILTLLFLTG